MGCHLQLFNYLLLIWDGLPLWLAVILHRTPWDQRFNLKVNEQRMKIFITGATGYIGQKIMERLLDRGDEVHALCRNIPDLDVFSHKNLKVFQGDILDRDRVKKAMLGCTQVYHVAGYARVWAKSAKTYFNINVAGTVNILQAALEQHVEKVVFTSTGGTYGVSNGKPINEDMIRVIDFFNEYESSKFMAEEKVQQFVNKGLPVVTVNPVRVYGPGLLVESNPLSIMIKSYLTGNWHVIPGNGEAIGSFSYIDDVVEGHLLAMEKGKPGEKYILGGENADFNTFFSKIKKISERDYFLVKIPLPIMMLFGWKEEVAAKLFGATPVITRKWIRKYHHDMACSSKKAITELGYTITPLEEGLTRTIEWLRQKYYIYT
jgi:NAD+-dependent farnesol dehydrogenase